MITEQMMEANLMTSQTPDGMENIMNLFDNNF